MSSACTPILVGMAFSILEIMLHSKAAKFSLRTMDYYDVTSMDINLVGGASLVMEILLSSKKAKFPFPTMDYYDVTNMHTNFGGCGFFCIRTVSFSFLTMDYIHGHQKIHASKD